MNTPPQPSLKITANYLGPVFSLEGTLSSRAQNLVFARSGTGKSFLARAFRYLDLHGQGDVIEDAATCLVSDESPDGSGKFSFLRGTQSLGELLLEKAGTDTTTQDPNVIFHVFSEDFVSKELREREYSMDGEIENQIAVDSETIALKDTQDALTKAHAQTEKAFVDLATQLDNDKLTALHEKAGVNKNLNEYRMLSLDNLLTGLTEKPESPERSFAEILVDLDSLKSLPAEPAYPGATSIVQTHGIELEALKSSLERITSPSSVSQSIKEKIEAHHAFFATGIEMVQEDSRETCPFCEQGIAEGDPKSIIDSYVEYFADEEEKHKSELRGHYKALMEKDAEIAQVETAIAKQTARYDGLKRFVPSKKDGELSGGDKEVGNVRELIKSYLHTIEEKAKNLSIMVNPPDTDLLQTITALNKVIEANNTMASDLAEAVEKSDDERRALQRKSCSVFEQEFAIQHWNAVEGIRSLTETAERKARELEKLEKSSPSTDAKSRVAQTFESLLRDFFSDKYVFDKDTFVLTRGQYEMVRGPHRTLSDGEKTAIAFCYFVACIHRKVQANSDYQKLYLVFDDPVTSMSYDFVFAIAQTLKNLNISTQGEVSANPGLMDGNNRKRPELLILTHSSYFFNVCQTNRVIAPESAFALYANGATHNLSPLKKYVAPFDQQLRHVYEVANSGTTPDHWTGNAIRSVLEAVGRFCRPDKSDQLMNFIGFLAGEEGITLKSVLINNLSHGSYYDETPTVDDLRLACEETIEVVKKYAAGQIELIRAELAGQ